MNLQLILKNASFLFIGNVMVRMLTAISAIVVARYLGAEHYGILSIALIFSTFTSSMTDLGLTHTFIREGIKSEKDISKLLNSYLVARLCICVCSSIIIFILVSFMYRQEEIRNVILLMVIPTIFGAALQSVGTVYYQTIEKMKFTAIIRTLAGLISITGLFISVYLECSLPKIALTYGVCSLLGGIISISLIINKIKFYKGLDNSILKGLSAFTLTAFLTIIMPLIGPIILEKVSNLKEVGYFNAALRIPSVLYQVPGIIAAAFYPVLFRLIAEKKNEMHTQMIVKEIKLMTLLSVFMVIPIIEYPREIIHLLLGEQWEGAIQPLQILCFIVLLQSLNFPLADSLTTRGLQNRRFQLLSVSFVVSVVVYILLGVNLGSQGAAIAALITEFVFFVGLVIVNKNGIKLVIIGAGKNIVNLFIVLSFNFMIFNRFGIWVSLILSYLILIMLMWMDKDIKSLIKSKIVNKLV
ncbi:oligosaccharide flippase family protein [Bacillus cereus]|uniref:oligosaccharide flippase family protein n=1 Tax=Bacillus cereus TaxID=1396 RepID=UPI00094459E9|nr:oligosaccharide flippase family protein [Bacillus cereus]MDA1968370.1 oligosaccharide flippase family protein [Bacillus cereus]PFN21285.1 sugar translocase [Bacillus cereus]